MSQGNLATAAAEVWREGALYKGLSTACLRLIPMAMVSFGTYEFARLQITRLQLKLDDLQCTRDLDSLSQSSRALAVAV